MFGGCFQSPEPEFDETFTTLGFLTRTVFIVGGILVAGQSETLPPCQNGITAVLQKNLSLTILFAILRLILQIPGMFCSVFYYASIATTGVKLVKNYEAICCDTSKKVFQIFLGIATVAACIGFEEKSHGCFLPTSLLIDLLALGLAVRIKPWFTLTVCEYTGYNLQVGTSTPKVQKLITWISDGIVILVAARHTGMMLYCSGIISEPCRISEMTLFQ